jgi:hypothetical protein
LYCFGFVFVFLAPFFLGYPEVNFYNCFFVVVVFLKCVCFFFIFPSPSPSLFPLFYCCCGLELYFSLSSLSPSLFLSIPLFLTHCPLLRSILFFEILLEKILKLTKSSLCLKVGFCVFCIFDLCSCLFSIFLFFFFVFFFLPIFHRPFYSLILKRLLVSPLPVLFSPSNSVCSFFTAKKL